MALVSSSSSPFCSHFYVRPSNFMPRSATVCNKNIALKIARNDSKLRAERAEGNLVTESDTEQKQVETTKPRKETVDAVSNNENNYSLSSAITEEITTSIKVLKSAAKSRKVPSSDVISALGVLRKAKLDPSNFLHVLGGTQSPGRTWMLIFTAKAKQQKGFYFPVTAVQRFDASAMRIENGIYLGPLGCLTFEGRFSWKKRILAFIFKCINIKIGPLGPLKINLAKEADKGRTPTTKDPFFIWFYVDEEIAVAQGRGGGIAFWCRCKRVT
eukprot:TRINITY_DN1738_c0_g1_i2.p1 TRINITY_DN1738_c0_g1~~TRINITY_DN1738_c0_g1_i2.p1  ORF type:complete len:271 (+),score=47.42 TRINITY_DN1738_c0_g1_i2:171-983(+)